MVLANVLELSVLKILHNFFPCKIFVYKKVLKVSKITKSVQCDLTFIFIELQEQLPFCENMSNRDKITFIDS